MDRLFPDCIRTELDARNLGHRVLYYDRVASTNDVAHQEAITGASEGLLVLAEEQTAGRGRLKRSWFAPAGSSLLMSLLVRPAAPALAAAQLTMCLGLGALEGIEESTGLRPSLKWPNDLVLHGRKLGGMLSETRLSGEQLDYAVLGLGINANLDFAAPDVPAEIAPKAISLSEALGHPVDRSALIVAIVAHFDGWYKQWSADRPIHRSWAERLDTLGRMVAVTWGDDLGRVQDPPLQLRGLAQDVTPEGALVLYCSESGEVRQVWSGDIVHLTHV